MNKFRNNTDKDVETTISVDNGTTIHINVSLHPKDVDRLHDVIDDFLKSCTITNEKLNEFKKWE